MHVLPVAVDQAEYATTLYSLWHSFDPQPPAERAVQQATLSRDHTMLDVAIAGGGPGGLAAAAAILRAAPGLSVAVLERSTLRPRGANVSLMPNGVHALAAIDPALAAQLLAGDATSWARKVFTAEGQLVKHQEDCNLYGVLAHGPVPSLAWHALQALLAGALPLGVLRQGTSVVGYEQDASAGCVRVRLEPGGEEMAARLLVGADGGQSCVRQQLLQVGWQAGRWAGAFSSPAAACAALRCSRCTSQVHGTIHITAHFRQPHQPLPKERREARLQGLPQAECPLNHCTPAWGALQDGPPTYVDTVIWRAVAPLPDWWPMDHGACFFGRPPQMFNTYTLPG